MVLFSVKVPYAPPSMSLPLEVVTPEASIANVRDCPRSGSLAARAPTALDPEFSVTAAAPGCPRIGASFTSTTEIVKAVLLVLTWSLA